MGPNYMKPNVSAHGFTDGSVDALASLVGSGSEVLMPSQWRDQNRRVDPYQRERRLWLAAFRSHLDDWRVAHSNDRLFPSPARRELWRLELTEWFNDDSDVVMRS